MCLSIVEVRRYETSGVRPSRTKKPKPNEDLTSFLGPLPAQPLKDEAEASTGVEINSENPKNSDVTKASTGEETSSENLENSGVVKASIVEETNSEDPKIFNVGSSSKTKHIRS
ncbi:uncharacterized protein LOC120162075 [Hibiscus syriacus]|uniref:uncharacterized protein LOC120162075 n=1 Tax=Hibiscus syriacus TaxID=106335 RepID=UPI0019217468|nr:uncharacterized protein LOC120162075 [Hibiscus syriacus]